MIVVGFHDHQALRIVPRKQSWSFSLLCIWISFEGFACTWCLIVSLDLVVYSVYYCRLQPSTALQISSMINILELCFHWAKWIYLSYWYKANDDLWEDVDNFVVWVDTRPQRVWDTIERSGRKLGWHHIMTLSPGLKKWSYPDAGTWYCEYRRFLTPCSDESKNTLSGSFEFRPRGQMFFMFYSNLELSKPNVFEDRKEFLTLIYSAYLLCFTGIKVFRKDLASIDIDSGCTHVLFIWYPRFSFTGWK